MRLSRWCIALLLSGSSVVVADEAIDVPYFHQLDNAFEAERACNITSLAMVLAFYGVEAIVEGAHSLPDQLYLQSGIVQDPQTMADAFNQAARSAGSNIRDIPYTDGTIEQLQQELAQGRPVIVHGWFTRAGHIMVVVDFDGEYYTVQDPYFYWLGEKFPETEHAYDRSRTGELARYAKAEFEYAINDNGTGDDLWLHTFREVRDENND